MVEEKLGKVEVSVIIPVYNAEKYLRQCLNSIFSQSFQKIEVIMVNDGSKDCSGAIMEEYVQKYPHKAIGIHQENQGQSAARNVALKHAKGKYVVFIDSDDYIAKDYIRVLYEKAESTNSDMVICNYTKVTDDGKQEKKCSANFMENGVRIPSYISCNRIIKRKMLESCNFHYEEGAICEDIPAMLRLEAAAENVQIIDEYGYYYRTNPQSTTSTMKDWITMEKLPLKTLDECVRFCRQRGKNIPDELLEFYLCRIWTTLLFDIGRGCSKKVRNEMCDEAVNFMKKYFPNYHKNPYIKLKAFKTMPAIQKWGTWLFVQAMYFRVLKLFVCCYSLL